VTIDAYRRQLQRTYLDLVNMKINGAAPNMPTGPAAAYFASSGDEKPFYRAELISLNKAVIAAINKAGDKETVAHLEGARDQIAKILDPKFAPPSGGGSGSLFIFADAWSGLPQLTSEDALQPENCWPDYIIRP